MKIRLLDGSGVIQLRYVFEDMDRHGNVRIYVRKGRNAPKVRLREPVGSAGFIAEYQRALAGEVVNPTTRPKTISGRQGTFAWLINSYYQSPEYRQLAPSTKQVRRRILDMLCHRIGTASLNDFKAHHIRKLRDDAASERQPDGQAVFKPEAANGQLKALKALFKWAYEASLIQHNPAREVPKIRNRTDGHHVWSEDEVKQYEARHPEGTKARLALMLLLYTGVRRSDAVAFGRQMERDGALNFRQAKTGKWLTIPIIQPLREEIDRHPTSHLTYLTTEYGHSFSAAGFGNKFRKWCNEAGLQHCSAHGLRKAGATRAANNGATAHQLKAIFGWAGIDEAERYTRKVDQQRLAQSGMHYLERERKADK